MRVHMTRKQPREPLSRWTALGLGCGVMSLIVALFFIYLFFSAFRIPSTLTSEPRSGTASEAAAARATTQFRQLENAMHSGSPVRQTIRLRDEDLNSLFVARSTQVRLPQDIERATVQFRDGIIHASAVTRWRGRKAYVQLDIRPLVEPDGTVRVAVEGGKVGRLPLPRYLRREIEERINNEITKNLRQGSVVIEGVAVQNGVLSVDLLTRSPLRR